MTSPVLTRLSATLLIFLGALLLPISLGATESGIDTKLTELIAKCVKLLDDGDLSKSKDGADACERVTNIIKARAEMQQKSVDVQRSMKERERWESFGWPSLILLDLLLVAIVGAILLITKRRLPTLVDDPDGKVSFSRVVGLLGISAIFVASAVLLNVILTHLYIFKAVPEGIISLFAPILTFIPTLLPYIFAKREELRARERARSTIRAHD